MEIRNVFFIEELQQKKTTLLPDGAQTHLLSGELPRSLDSVVLPLCLQVDVQADAQARDLIGQQLVSRTRSLELIFEHVHLALHGLVNKGGFIYIFVF